MADREFKIDSGNKLLMVVALLALAGTLVFLLGHLAGFLGQLSLGERDPAPGLVQTVDQRMAPVGRVVVGSVEKDAAPAAARPPIEVYRSVCAACHDTGAAGAPKVSDSVEWTRRFDEKGLDTLVSHSINGFQGMPARGGNATLSDDEVRNVVAYMLSEAGVSVSVAAATPATTDAAAEPAAAPTAAVSGSAEAGKALYAACVSCHGAEGAGMGIFPQVSGQSAEYVSGRLTAYRAGETVGPNSALMQPMAMGLSDQDIADLATYIAGLGAPEPAAPAQAAPQPEPAVAAGDPALGKARYAPCIGCHGPVGQGMGIFPKISGQSAAYVAERLKQYRANQMVGPNSMLMIPQAMGLSDDDIANLAAYIAAM